MNKRIRSLVVVLFVTVMMSFTAFAQTNMEAEALAKVNQIRIANGLSEVKYSAALENAASVRAEEITYKFSHTRANGSDWYTVNPDIMYGENLAEGYNSADEVVNAWMNSESHRANILRSDFTTCSISTTTKNGRTYWAQEFGI
ncbi:CAP domain-containing protein [Oribacterium sp. WCC10]|uniref:CAP domain-containing protein n=1 Tax=Oribacterium sp. WCC10 TaxID=1855343 RepID=UPI0008F0D747|nr:CAP domain-containing protein [Oribacterium sp. WCC10]SFG71762.1 Cysteine-rich secretory protein family protein [Oribacterium sp. WCC10]